MNYAPFHTNEIRNDKICVQIKFRLQLAHSLRAQILVNCIDGENNVTDSEI